MTATAQTPALQEYASWMLASAKRGLEVAAPSYATRPGARYTDLARHLDDLIRMEAMVEFWEIAIEDGAEQLAQELARALSNGTRYGDRFAQAAADARREAAQRVLGEVQNYLDSAAFLKLLSR
jgi:hypothetical protein